MDADERESNTLDEDVMDLGVHEDVVDKQLAHVHVRNRGRVVTGGIIDGRVSNVLENLVGVSKSNVNKSLTVRDGHGRDRQTRVLVKPEEKGHPKIELRLNGLRGLGTTVDLDLLAHTGTTSKTGVHETVIGKFLSHVALPADLLVRGDKTFIPSLRCITSRNILFVLCYKRLLLSRGSLPRTSQDTLSRGT
jgi:hypothetical protein